MKRFIRRPTRDEEIITSSQVEQDDFDARWDAKFGEPSTDVFDSDEFLQYMEEVINFE